ncbi:MAG: Unknown protein [uncultured Thiotrichaceae bacterium]|uniref:UPF0250 protein HELGO_WM27899 n=1 Tax=uncultured Thiotrichaceae bacterium TaxID=298394 RepID=A0A6S6S2C4_9GAMM|nr:MAG: Unknown protein [uncultured Thiotrichaceae bacterium]
MHRFGQEKELALEFPCDFPIKVAGKTHATFEVRICEIAERHDPAFSADKIRRNQSRTGKYSSVTLGITATSKEQIDMIYRDLKSCELVLWAL